MDKKVFFELFGIKTGKIYVRFKKSYKKMFRAFQNNLSFAFHYAQNSLINSMSRRGKLRLQRLLLVDLLFVLRKTRIPVYGWLSMFLCLTAWTCSWLHITPFSRYSFFPLWLGYIFFVDALVVSRCGQSLLTRIRWKYVRLFLISSVFWWIFEGFNLFTQNWQYKSDQSLHPFAHLLLATLDFSTVLPAVIETAELLSSFHKLRPRLSPPYSEPCLSLSTLILLFTIGIACFVLLWKFSHYAFVLVWLCITLILDPLNYLVKRKSVLAHIAAKDWHICVLPLAGLVCGFLWEMWNFYAFPKWQYSIPYVGFWKIFEMPVLGYMPFALELFSMYQFTLFLIGQQDDGLNL